MTTHQTLWAAAVFVTLAGCGVDPAVPDETSTTRAALTVPPSAPAPWWLLCPANAFTVDFNAGVSQSQNGDACLVDNLLNGGAEGTLVFRSVALDGADAARCGALKLEVRTLKAGRTVSKVGSNGYFWRSGQCTIDECGIMDAGEDGLALVTNDPHARVSAKLIALRTPEERNSAAVSCVLFQKHQTQKRILDNLR